jgi:riboflavin kinase/FMN adenylyltransferase
MNLSAQEYIEEFLVKSFAPHTIIIGYDHKFGKGRKGDINLLLEYASVYQFQVHEISAQLIQENTISSTKIRTALTNGNLEEANLFLQNHYILSGTVIHGDQRGRTIGFPTANIQVHNRYKLLPKNGVYAVKAIFQGLEFCGILNIGKRPTVKEDAPISIEAHLFDFNQEIYDEYISLSLVGRLRDEKKFNGIEELILAIKEDIRQAKNILNNNS